MNRCGVPYWACAFRNETPDNQLMSQSLSGKTAAITGGTRGIGFAIARTLLAEGVRVAICGRTQESVDRALAELAAPEGQAFGMAVNVAEVKEVTGFFQFVDEKLDKLNILVNNAGIGIFRPVADISTEDWRQLMGINLDGVFYCSREAVLRMRASGGGSIINLSSLAGKNPFAGGAAYNASKFGLNGFSEALMLDHRRDRIRVTYIMPGSVNTDFSPRTAKGAWKIDPQDVADVVLSVLRMPERTTVSRVEIRPSLPQK